MNYKPRLLNLCLHILNYSKRTYYLYMYVVLMVNYTILNVTEIQFIHIVYINMYIIIMYNRMTKVVDVNNV